MKELHAFRKFLSEGKMDKFKVGQTVKYKAGGKEKEGEIEKIDGIYLKIKGDGSIPYQSVLEEKEGTWGGNKGGKFDKKNMPWGGRKGKNPIKDVPWGGNKEENVSENTSMPDIEIMGEKFNFSDICPSAHKLVQNQALVHQGHHFMGPTVYNFAFRHKQFFNWEREALGPQGITVDEFNDEVKRLYVEILNIAEKLGVRKQAKEYMDMHMAKIKDHGFKASEPGGSSDMNFGNISENIPTLDFRTKGSFSHSFKLGTEPKAYELVKRLIDTHIQNFGELSMMDDVFKFAEENARFFGWQREALNRGVTLGEYLEDIKPVYNKVLEIANTLGVYDETKEYMDVHMAKIKNEGIKGNKFDLNEKGYEPTDKELDFADEIEYEEDWRDERDAMFGKPMGKLEEALKRVRKVLGDSIEGYMDLHKNDVVLESLLGKKELNEDNTEDTFDDYFAPVVGGNKTMPAMNIQQALEDKAIDVEKLSPDYLADFYNFPELKETLDPEMINPQEFKKAMGRLMQVSYKDITGEEKFENILPYPNYYTFVRFGNDIYLAHEYGKYHTKLSFGTRLRESNAERNPLRGIKNMFQAIVPLELDTTTLGSLGYAKAVGLQSEKGGYDDEKYQDLIKQAQRFRVDVDGNVETVDDILNAYNAIAAAANEYELREGPLDERQKYADDQLKFKEGDIVYFKSLKGGKKLPMTITGPGKFMASNKLGAGGKEIVYPVKGGPGGKGMYAADDLVKEEPFSEDQKKIEEGPVQTFTSGLDRYQSYPHVYVFKVRTMSTNKQGGKFVYNYTYEVKDGLDWNGVLAQVDQLIASPETIGVGVDIYYTTGQEEGQLGGQAEVVRWSHDAVWKDGKSDYISNAKKNQFENEEAERIIAIRNQANSSLMGRPPQNVDNQAEKLYPAIKRMKDEVKSILANK